MGNVERQPPSAGPAILGKYRDEVEAALVRALSPENSQLLDIMRFHLGWVDEDGHTAPSSQGKGMRSSLCMFACEAIGGCPEQALPVAAAVELIHNFSLIHDDIQDGDTERRHRPTVWARWGKPQALHAGNVMRVLADLAPQHHLNHPIAPETGARCSLVLTSAYLEMIEGQYLDLDFEGRTDVKTSDYLDMISRKTGALIRCAMELGAIAGNGDARAVTAMARCGQSLGYAFQVRDDYLGIWGYEEVTGKAIGNDIRMKKSSLPLVHVMERAGTEERERIQSIYAKERVEDEDVAAVMAILGELGTQEYVQRLAQEHATRARQALEGIGLVPGAQEELDELLSFLIARQY
ncbi:MAG: polyprenyl synthetase family protein [Chloroflexi bacterium]|nr:polyprenyl synthetase family protein [Chloroflexota bacterium]